MDKFAEESECLLVKNTNKGEKRVSWYNMWSWPYWDQQIDEGQDNDNLMYSGEYTKNYLRQDRNNNGQVYKINSKQAEILYNNRDNKKKKK